MTTSTCEYGATVARDNCYMADDYLVDVCLSLSTTDDIDAPAWCAQSPGALGVSSLSEERFVRFVVAEPLSEEEHLRRLWLLGASSWGDQ